MRNLVPVFIIGIVMLLLLNACNKESVTTTSTGGSYSMKFIYNDTTASFNTCTVSTVIEGNVPSEVLISGFTTTNNKITGKSFELDLVADIDSLKAGQVFPAATTINQLHSSTLYFFPDSLRTYTTQVAKPIGSVTITSVTSSEIKGTFNGGLYGWQDEYAEILDYNISGGTFVARR
ncbi:hypothetical protein [Mucilaginibacter sp.]